MVDAISSNEVSDVSMNSECYWLSEKIDQTLINQLFMFILGCNSNPSRGSSPQEEALKQELMQLESSLPSQQAAKLRDMLSRLPTDTRSKTYSSELTEAFSMITAFIVSIMPNGLSSEEKKELNAFLDRMPTHTFSKTYEVEVAVWAAHLSAFIASSLPGVLSSRAKQELNELLRKQPTDTHSKLYFFDMIKFLSKVQVFIAENVPSSLSPSDKAKLDEQLKKILSINPYDKDSPEEEQIALAKLEQMLSDMFF